MILYIIKSIAVSGLLYLVFKLALSNSTSFKFNRFFLLTTILLSVSTPLFYFSYSPTIDDNLVIAQHSLISEEVNSAAISIQESIELSSEASSFMTIAFYLYATVSLILFIRILANLLKMFPKGGEQLTFNGLRIIYTNHNSIYSFFNRLYLPQETDINQLGEGILEHEKAHAKQLHSIDNLLVELYLTLFWFNPIAYLIKKAIQTNHEYLADYKAIEKSNGLQYVETILSHLKTKEVYPLSSNFSYLSIKNRIKMIQTKKSRLNSMLRSSASIAVGISFVTLFAFKSNQVIDNIDRQVSSNNESNLFERPSGSPILNGAIVKIQSSFGMRKHPITKQDKMHKGVDYIAKEGTPILATGNGKVVKATYSKGYGNHIIIEHNEKYKTLYAHLASINVNENEEVTEGQSIGIIGTTGKSISVHLHYELHEFDQPIDPIAK